MLKIFINFLDRWLLSTNHQVIGTLFFIFGSIACISIISMSILIKLELVQYDNQIFYRDYQLLLNGYEGLIVFFMVMPILIGGFGNWFVPLMIEASEMAFPRMNYMSFWLLPMSFLFFLLGCILQPNNIATIYLSLFLILLSNFLNSVSISYTILFNKNYKKKLFSLNSPILFIFCLCIFTIIFLLLVICIFINYKYVLSSLIFIRVVFLIYIYFTKIVNKSSKSLNTYRNFIILGFISCYLIKNEQLDLLLFIIVIVVIIIILKISSLLAFENLKSFIIETLKQAGYTEPIVLDPVKIDLKLIPLSNHTLQLVTDKSNNYLLIVRSKELTFVANKFYYLETLLIQKKILYENVFCFRVSKNLNKFLTKM